jgi:hypothetical protein
MLVAWGFLVFPEAVLDVLGDPLAGRRVKRRIWRFAEALDGWPGATALALYVDLRGGRARVLVDEERAPGSGLHRVRLLELLDGGAREAGSMAARGRLYVSDGDLASDPSAGRETRAKAERYARVAYALRETALAFYADLKSGRVDVLLDAPSRRGLKHKITLASLDELLARTQTQAGRPRGGDARGREARQLGVQEHSCAPAHPH